MNSDGEVVLVPMNQIPASQKWFWEKEWQEGEKAADADMKAGRVKSFDDDEDPITWLNSTESDEWVDGDK